MQKALQTKLEAVVKHYADQLDARIRSVSEEEFTNIALMQEIQDGIRVLCVILTTLKKTDGPQRSNDVSSLLDSKN